MEKYGTEAGVPFNGLPQMVRLSCHGFQQIILAGSLNTPMISATVKAVMRA